MSYKYDEMIFDSMDEVQDYVRKNIDEYEIADAIEYEGSISLTDIVKECLRDNSAEAFGNWMKYVIEQAVEDIVERETEYIFECED